MAAIAPTDPYAIFMRKVGYSVGLENTFDRVDDLLGAYIDNNDVTLAIWGDVLAGWGLKSENIADVLFALRFIHRTSGDVLVLENLDAMAVVRSLLKDASRSREACAFLLLWSILVNDGEIFVNLLLADFDESRVRENLSKMIQRKRAALIASFKGHHSAARINRVVNIDRQSTNRGSAGAGRSIASLKRTEPLQPARAPELSPSGSGNIAFSDDYFRKVPPKRRDWARSLNLWDTSTGLTDRGTKFLHALTQSGYINPDGTFTFWPMDYELRRSGFHPNQVPCAPKSLWTTLLDFGAAYAGLVQREAAPRDRDDAVSALAEFTRIFRTLHVRKAMLRRELPVLVAFPALVACATATRTPILDLPAAIEAEQSSGQRRIALRRSRNTGGALTVRY